MKTRIAFFDTKPYDKESFNKIIKDFEFEIKFFKHHLTEDNVDLEAANGKIKVVRVPAYSPNAVAEYTIALMMTLNRKIHRAYFRTRDANFSLHGLMGFDMKNKTAGVIGTGKIGKSLIRILSDFGMKVLAYDSDPIDRTP